MSGYSRARLSCADETRQGWRVFRPTIVRGGCGCSRSKCRGRVALVELGAKRFALEEDDALIFVLFDVGGVLLFPVAVAYNQMPAWTALVISLFALTLLASLLYAWRKGVLEWD